MNIQEILSFITEAAAAMSWVEALAVLLGLAYVLLAAAESIWCWPAALLSVSLYIYICLEAQLYAETGLQVFYWIMAIAGWWSWTRKKTGAQTAESSLSASSSATSNNLPITTWPLSVHALVIGLNILATLVLAWFLESSTQAANPYLDSFTTVFSLFTTWMVTQKVLENWLYWVVIDAASVFLYAGRDLYLTSLLFIIYTFIAVAGFIKWYRRYKHQPVAA